MKALVAGWFSFEQMGASAGDILARDVVCGWLTERRVEYEIALAVPFEGGIDWRQADPSEYSHIIFVCGPFGNGWPLTEFLDRFAGRHLVGIDVSMLDRLDNWNPFDLLLERDSSSIARPDISLLSRQDLVPVVGLVLIDAQPEYTARDLRDSANDALRRLLDKQKTAVVRIDTRLDENSTGLRSAIEVESVIAKMDVVLTTRLHGLVLAIKNGVPALAIDSVKGGDKVTRQAHSIGWPLIFAAEDIKEAALLEAFKYCLTKEARSRAHECREQAILSLSTVRDKFLEAFI